MKQGTSDDNTQKSISEVLLHTQRGNPKIIEIEKQLSKSDEPRNKEEQGINSFMNLRGTSKYNYVRTRNQFWLS